jgi:hypothetical protein
MDGEVGARGAADLVFDRGIVSEANLAGIRQREGQYLVGTPLVSRRVAL